MANSIIVSVSELRSRIQDIRRSGLDYVELTVSDPEEFDGDFYPATLDFSGCRQYGIHTWTDFESLEAVPNEADLNEASLTAIHMRSRHAVVKMWSYSVKLPSVD